MTQGSSSSLDTDGSIEEMNKETGQGRRDAPTASTSTDGQSERLNNNSTTEEYNDVAGAEVYRLELHTAT